MNQQKETNKKPFGRRKKRLLYLLFILVFQEVVIRICFPLPELKNFDRSIYIDYPSEWDGDDYWRSQTRTWYSELDTNVVFEHRMNRYGFRDGEWAMNKIQGKKRVLFIGDSFVEGATASQDETIPNGFLDAAGQQDYEVMNAGMLGVGLTAYLQLAADMIPVYQPDVAILCLYANDFAKEPVVPEFYLEPKKFSKFKPRIFEVIQQSYAKKPVLFRWNRSRKPFFPVVPHPGNPWTNNEESLSEHVMPHIAEVMKKGTFNYYRTNFLHFEEKHLKQAPKLGETIPFFLYTCEQNKVEPLVVYFPSRSQVTKYYYQFDKEYCQLLCNDTMDLTTEEYHINRRVLAEQCKSFNVNLIDLTDEIRRRESDGQHLYWNYDEHMRGSSYLLMGNLIWEKWQEK